MRALVQRVTRASVRVDDETVGAIDGGLCILVGVTHDDTPADAEKLAAKVHGLRVFDDDAGVMNLSLAETGGAALVVSQFTLYGDTRKGRRPSWVAAAPARACRTPGRDLSRHSDARNPRRNRRIPGRYGGRAGQRRAGHSARRGTEPVACRALDRIESSHSIWLFDTERKRFRRLPRGADADAPALDADWEQYFALELDEATGAFTVTLNEDGTRLLRAFRDEPAAGVEGPTRRDDITTTELRIPRPDA